MRTSEEDISKNIKVMKKTKKDPETILSKRGLKKNGKWVHVILDKFKKVLVEQQAMIK